MVGPAAETFAVRPPTTVSDAAQQTTAVRATEALAFLPPPNAAGLDGEDDHARRGGHQGDQPGKITGGWRGAQAGEGVVERRNTQDDRDGEEQRQKAGREQPQAHFIDGGHDTP